MEGRDLPHTVRFSTREETRRVAELSPDPERELRAKARSCGTCSHCCTVLRVDPLGKPAGTDCRHQRGSKGCGIYDARPSICRGYRCLWMQGGLEDDERPDVTGGIVDLETTGIGLRLSIREVEAGAFATSSALQAIAERYRSQIPVRITDAEDVRDRDRPFRVLLADGVEHRIAGEWVESHRDGVLVGRRKLPWFDRLGRRVSIWWRERSLARVREVPSGNPAVDNRRRE